MRIPAARLRIETTRHEGARSLPAGNAADREIGREIEGGGTIGMKRLLALLFGLPAFVILVAFALANRKIVMVSFNPIAPDQPLLPGGWLGPVSMPAWVLLYAGIFIGLIAGGIATWIKQGKWRKKARQAKFALDREEAEKRRLERRLKESASPALPSPGSR